MRNPEEGVCAAPLWQQVSRLVRRHIQTGRLRPGDRVVESQLAEQFGISRNPIREAVRQLQQQGILEYRPNAGTVVTHLSPGDIRFAIEARAFLEARAARAMVESADRASTEALEAVVQRMSLLTDDEPLEQAEPLDEAFHVALIEASGIKVLVTMWRAVNPYTWASLASQAGGRAPVSDPKGMCSNHMKLLHILKSGNAEEAEEAIRNHIMRYLR